MNELLAIGFELAADWHRDGERLGVSFVPGYIDKPKLLYAFVCDGEVKYVGVSVRTLRERIGNYRSNLDRTNARIRKYIGELLANGSAVQVYTFADTGLMHYGPFHLNLAAGLEAGIIGKLRPEWNIASINRGSQSARTEKDIESAVLARLDDSFDLQEGDDVARPEAEPVAQASFEFNLAPSYRDRGFFNGGVSSSDLLGAHGEKIEISFGDEAPAMLGTINRRVTGNGTPRVFGGKAMQQRFQAVPEQSVMQVDVYSPTSIRISRR
jgi:hypothetical protein